MGTAEFCGGCRSVPVDGRCRHSLRHAGIMKVHWESWSDCNLSCPFCYRARGNPLSTGDAELLISAVSTGGAEGLAFAGGDPSLRKDLRSLVERAKLEGLAVEIHTNAQHVTEDFREALAAASLVGVSIDGPTATVHDQFRSRTGNFRKVLNMLDFLAAANVPVIARTVVALPNYDSVTQIGSILARYPNLIRWSLMEFSPVQLGYVNRTAYEIDRDVFNRVGASVREKYDGVMSIDLYRLEDKVGTYMLITPDGRVYGTAGNPIGGAHPTIGSILETHLRDLVDMLPFDATRHWRRYGSEIGPQSSTAHIDSRGPGSA
jgi:MoaA/NifB/PqqE/SkfB family radical SAM enzyme